MTDFSLVPGFMSFDHGEGVRNFNGFWFSYLRQGVETVVEGVVATLWETKISTEYTSVGIPGLSSG